MIKKLTHIITHIITTMNVTIMKLRKQVQILKRTNAELESKLALQKGYNDSNLRMIDKLRYDNIELSRELKGREHIEFIFIPKRCNFIKDGFSTTFEVSEPVITDEIKVSVFDSLLAKGFIRKSREENTFVTYEIILKTEV